MSSSFNHVLFLNREKLLLCDQKLPCGMSKSAFQNWKMDISKRCTGLVETSSNYPQVVPTGLFLYWKKSSLLIRIVKDMLQERFNTIAVLGPRQHNDTCEIFLKALNYGSPAYFDGSKDLLENYLHLVEESQTNTMIKKQKQPVVVVDLIDDEEDDKESHTVLNQTVLDDDVQLAVSEQTVDESVVIIDLENPKSAETEKRYNVSSICSIERGIDVTKEAPIEEVIIIDPVEENSSHPTLKLSLESSDKGSCQQPEINRRKRKRHLESVVETLDDDVIVLDEFPSVPRISTEDNSPASNKENVNSITITLDGDNRKIHHVSTTKAMCEGINRLDLTTSSTLIEIDDDEAPTSSKLLMSQSYVPPKKVSKLTYKRTAHLVESLTKGSKGNSVETAADSNIYNPNANLEKRTGLRPIVIDGNNVAISHGEFSLKRLQICINYFEKRGHRQIKAFLPHHRINRETYSGLNLMERQGTVVFTPSRKVNGKRVSSYDDRFIVQYATESGGVIVTTDNYRDLLQENPNWKETIEQRILMFSWVDDVLMFPQDPMGRHGPPLDEFLKFPN